jgi:PPOX class probable F420-dependent enzyme
MRKMTRAECFAFLVARPRTAKLATVRPDGRPHVAPIWIDLDGEQIVFTTWHESVKARNLLHSPWVSLVVDDDAPPFAFVKVDGNVSFLTDMDELRHWATRIAGRYMGPDQADAFGRRNAVDGEWLARITPVTVQGQDDVAGW